MEPSHVMLLVRLDVGYARELDLQHGPVIVDQHQDIRNALSHPWVVLEDDGAWEAFLDLLGQLPLVLGFGHRSGYEPRTR